MPETAIPVYRFQQYALADLQGRLAEVASDVRDVVDAFPARVAFRCALAHVDARLGRVPEAQQTLDELRASRFSTLPFDQEWLWGMSLLAETAVLLDDRDSASALYDLLTPWASLNAGDHPEGIRGSVSRYLGMLAAMARRWRQAEQHFVEAL